MLEELASTPRSQLDRTIERMCRHHGVHYLDYLVVEDDVDDDFVSERDFPEPQNHFLSSNPITDLFWGGWAARTAL